MPEKLKSDFILQLFVLLKNTALRNLIRFEIVSDVTQNGVIVIFQMRLSEI